MTASSEYLDTLAPHTRGGLWSRLRPQTATGLVVAGLGLLAAAALVRWWFAPNALQLTAQYHHETEFVANDRVRPAPGADWEAATLLGRRIDQALAEANGVVIVQSGIIWQSAAGAVLFESGGLYGVDSRTRQNVAGYGNEDRLGQFLFPPGLGEAVYTYWDPNFIGPRTATFLRSEELDGISTHVYSFTGAKMDETAGYAVLGDVPERFSAHTDAAGTMWIEPISGIVVNYEEWGVSYFVDPQTGQRLADFHVWRSRYTPETWHAQLALAQAARWRISTLQTWLPGALLGLGVTAAAAGMWKGKLGRRQVARLIE